MYFRILGPITDAEVIAEGRGIRIRKHLVRKYGDGNWRKMKGIAFVETRSDKGYAEVHWYECHGRGRFDYKFKRFLSIQ